jgi:hypothetical protein
MIKRELMKDPKLAEENWERFLPSFRKRREKKRGPPGGGEGVGPTTSGSNDIPLNGQASTSNYAAGTGEGSVIPPPAKKQKKEKKPYTPFPPAQLPSKVRPFLSPLSTGLGADNTAKQIDLQLESGEYFLKPQQKQAREDEKRKAKVRLVPLPLLLLLLLTILAHSNSSSPTLDKKSAQRRSSRRKKQQRGKRSERSGTRRRRRGSGTRRLSSSSVLCKLCVVVLSLPVGAVLTMRG